MQRLVNIRLVLLLLWLTASTTGRAETPPDGTGRADPARLAGRPELQTAAPTGRIVVKLAGAASSADRARVAALAGAPLRPRLDPDALAALATKSPRGADRTGSLARYAELDAGHLDRAGQLLLIRRLVADPAVVSAFLEPRAVPAALGFDAFAPDRLAAPAPGGPQTDAAATPDFTEWQGSLADAPQGIGAWSAWSQPGARGGTVRIIDVEGAWLWAHEDLPAPFADLGQHINNVSWRNHGTAVVGQLRGIDNEYGIDGIVPDCLIGASSIGNQSVADAMLGAALHLDAGDLILIELHGAGPNSYEDGGQFGYVPMEFWPDNFEVIRALTDLGLIVVEAGGNGEQDLDDPLYQGLFDRSVRDSGAIMVGATGGSSLTPAWFTNHGTRVDLSGWGLNVATCGYGDLQDGAETEWYTLAFAGTSSASPIVTGAVASLQGMVEAAFGLRLDAYLARDILRLTGTATSGPELIGPRPDLVAAWALAGQGIGHLSGTVTEQGSGLPLAGVTVRVLPQGAVTATASDGTYAFSLLPESYDLEFSAYYHQTRVDAVAVAAGSNLHDTILTASPLSTVAGTVVGGAQQPLAGVRLVWAGEPLAAVQSGPDGAFTMPDVPAGDDYVLVAGGAPGHGAAALTLTAGPGPQAITVVLPPATHDFGDGPAGFTVEGGLWQLGDPSVAGVGPGAAFTGTSCWGIGLDGQGYPDEALAALWSPQYTAGQFSGDRLYLSFHYWSGTETGYDGVHVVLDQDGAVSVLQPLEGYTDLFLGGLAHQPGWSGTTDGWRPAIFDVTPQLATPTWRFGLRFGSDVYVTDEGFLVDGVTLHAVDAAVGVQDEPPLAAVPVLAARPNPFNPRVTLAWSLPGPADLDLGVYDLRGRLVRDLLRATPVAERGSVVWDGADRAGRPAPSGVYLVRLRTGAAPGGVLVTVERITLAR